MLITENQIFGAVIATLQAGFKTRGFTVGRNAGNVYVSQWYQPRVVGAPPAGVLCVLLSNVGNHRYGFLGRQDVWDQVAGQETHTERQAMQKTIQVTGQFKPLAPPNPLPDYDASDVTKLAATILASDAGRAQLKAAGFGIERITDIRQPYFKDESDQFEQVPSFDFTLDYTAIETTTTPVVTSTEIRVESV